MTVSLHKRGRAMDDFSNFHGETTLVFAWVKIVRSGILAAMAVSIMTAESAYAQTDATAQAELLVAHNGYRAKLGLVPLQWSGALALKAQSWADHLAQIGQLIHSGAGQNLAWATADNVSLTQLVDLWGNEQAYFRNGEFPAISTTGNWMDAGHYSQLVWAATRDVGCGVAHGYGREILVCDYDPPGNVVGERPY